MGLLENDLPRDNNEMRWRCRRHPPARSQNNNPIQSLSNTTLAKPSCKAGISPTQTRVSIRLTPRLHASPQALYIRHSRDELAFLFCRSCCGMDVEIQALAMSWISFIHPFWPTQGQQRRTIGRVRTGTAQNPHVALYLTRIFASAWCLTRVCWGVLCFRRGSVCCRPSLSLLSRDAMDGQPTNQRTPWTEGLAKTCRASLRFEVDDRRTRGVATSPLVGVAQYLR